MKLMDVPNADELSAKLEAKLNPQPQPGIPPEVEQMMQQGMERIQQLEGENGQLKSATMDKQGELQLKARELELKEQELALKMYEAETSRMQALQPPMAPASGRPRAGLMD
jgi:predicted nuclease with TOPRIM domain